MPSKIRRRHKASPIRQAIEANLTLFKGITRLDILSVEQLLYLYRIVPKLQSYCQDRQIRISLEHHTSFLDDKYTDILVSQRVIHLIDVGMELVTCPKCNYNHAIFHRGDGSLSTMKYLGTCGSSACKSEWDYEEQARISQEIASSERIEGDRIKRHSKSRVLAAMKANPELFPDIDAISTVGVLFDREQLMYLRGTLHGISYANDLQIRESVEALKKPLPRRYNRHLKSTVRPIIEKNNIDDFRPLTWDELELLYKKCGVQAFYQDQQVKDSLIHHSNLIGFDLLKKRGSRREKSPNGRTIQQFMDDFPGKFPRTFSDFLNKEQIKFIYDNNMDNLQSVMQDMRIRDSLITHTRSILGDDKSILMRQRMYHVLNDCAIPTCKYCKKREAIFDQYTTHSSMGYLEYCIDEDCRARGIVRGGISKEEEGLVNWLHSIYGGEIIQGYRRYGMEIDAYLPELDIGIEYNGTYYHSSRMVDKNYHKRKTDKLEAEGIRLIHVWATHWKHKKERMKGIIAAAIGMVDTRLYARKCQVSNIDYKTASEFLDENHIQGKLSGSAYMGLYNGNELVQVITMNKRDVKNNIWEIGRLCTKMGYNVVGGASRLFTHFIRKCQPAGVFSYSYRDYFTGGVYEKLGFKLTNISQPGYFYTDYAERFIHRKQFMKSKLIKSGAIDENEEITEREYMESAGYTRTYNAGVTRWEWTPGPS